MKTRIFSVAVVLVMLGIAVFSFRMVQNRRHPYAPTRPEGVPLEAVYIQGPDGKGRWDWCSLADQEIRCSIRTVSGTVLREGKFVPYRGPAPTSPADLKITQKSGDGWISLTNGCYLIPATDNESSKRYLDFMIGDAKSFDK